MAPTPFTATVEQVRQRLDELRLDHAEALSLLGLELTDLPPAIALLVLDGVASRIERGDVESLRIERAPRVCGGSARIAGTRIPIFTLEQYRRLGASDAEILHNFPALRARDLVDAWAYADRHRAEMDREIHENEVA